MCLLSMTMTMMIPTRPSYILDGSSEAVRLWVPHVTAVGPDIHTMQRQRIIPELVASPRACQLNTIQTPHRLMDILPGMDTRQVPHPITQINIAMA